MEGDAGASRLNPNETEDSGSEVAAEDGTDQTSKAEDEADEAGAAVHADAPTEDPTDLQPGAETIPADATGLAVDGKNPSRLGRGWLIGLAAALVLLAGGLGAGGYLALRS